MSSQLQGRVTKWNYDLRLQSVSWAYVTTRCCVEFLPYGRGERIRSVSGTCLKVRFGVLPFSAFLIYLAILR